MYGNRRRRGAPKDPPTVAMAEAKKVIAKGRPEAAHALLFDAISYRHRAQFDATFEEAMKMYIDVGVSILKSCKEGFLQYRSLVQQNHAASLERTINHFVDCVEAAGKAEIAKIGVDSDKQYESKTLQYQWESFQVVFTILRNNGKLNHVYCAVIDKALDFCLRLNRSTEFKKLNDTVRRRFGYVINNQSFDYALKINSQETLNAMLKVRLGMLGGALSMGLHQESFKTIKGLQKNIIDRSYDLKKQIEPELYSQFYEKLAAVFWSSNRFLLHSYAVFEAYKKLKTHIATKLTGKKNKAKRAKQETKLQQTLHEALLSVLIVPSSSVNDKNKTNSGNPATANNKYFTHSLFQLANDYFGHGRRKQIKPSQQGLLLEIMAEVHELRQKHTHHQSPTEPDDKEESDPFKNAKDLYDLMASNTFNPLTFTQSLNDIMARLETENNVNGQLYWGKVYEKGVTMLLKQLSVCYKSISWHRFSELTFPKDQLSDIDLERIITYSVYYDGTGCTISHSNKLISFDDNNLESEILSDSIVELNRSFMDIKRTKNLDVPDRMQRQNVYATIRTQVPIEHKQIDGRLREIQRQRVIERQMKLDQERQKKEKLRQEQAAREAAKRNEVVKAEENKKRIDAKQRAAKAAAEKHKKTVKIVENFAALLKKGGSTKKTEKRRQSNDVNVNKIDKLERQQIQLKRQIDQKLGKPRAALNEGEIENVMEQMLRIENKKKKKMLQIERMEFDHFCRASRRLAQEQIEEEMGRLDKCNIKQRRRLFKRLNEENRKKHAEMVMRRDRLRALNEKHLEAFKKIVRDETQRTQEKPKAKRKKQAVSQPTRDKKPKMPSPLPSPSPRPESRSKPAPAPTKYVPPRRELPRDPRGFEARMNGGSRGDDNPPAALTFAEKMRLRRANGGMETSHGGGFGSRFSRGSNDFQGQNRGSSMRGGGFQNTRPRSRIDFEDNRNSNNSNGSTMIRPQANK